MPDPVLVAMRFRGLLVGAAACLLLLGGCATNGNPRDPLEPLNRGVYKFNDVVDHVLVKPAAEIYSGVLPDFVRKGISNVFSNVNDVIVALNNLLQGKFSNAASDVGRIAINTTIGLLGIFDPATEAGLEKNNEDFGQTLGYWGIGDGPYLVLPFLGPSSFRDTAGWVGDVYAWPITYVDPNRDRNALIALRFVGIRAELLAASNILQTAALDPYEFTRDAYLQRRRNLVYDGKPPLDDGAGIRTGVRAAKAETPASPDVSEPVVESVLVSDESVATPAEHEARARAAAPQAANTTHNGDKPTRVVRIWLPQLD